jgi:hypothetical protein
LLGEELQECDSIYIVFISTNTYMGKMIRFFTKNEYSHVTISFDRDLRRMYSFARYYINSPILGGFVTESPLRYLYGNKDVQIKLCELPLKQEDYEWIQERMRFFHSHSDRMIYNTINAVLSLFGKRLNRNDMFTCLEFVTHLLRYPNIITIRKLEGKLKDYVIYQGSLRAVSEWSQEDIVKDKFFRRRRKLAVVCDTAAHFHKLVIRVLQVG